MNTFMNYNFNIKNIDVVTFVPPGHGVALHKNRPTHGIVYFTAGEREYKFDNGTVVKVCANEIVYLPRYSTYEVITSVPGGCYAINFMIDSDLTFKPFVFKTRNNNNISKHISTAKNVWKEKKLGYMLKAKAELYNIIYLMQQQYHSAYIPKVKIDMIKPATDYIHIHYTDELISIENLSKLCEITPEYFRKIFKNYYGVSPLAYINNLKITKAKELIESGLYTISEVASQSGYNDISHFSREFKKTTGFSPTEYSRRMYV